MRINELISENKRIKKINEEEMAECNVTIF